MKIILIRGAPAVGKTTITKNLVKKLKLEHNKNCAYICEDDFRKQMQFKYKSSDLQVHLNSVILIQNTIQTLLDLDEYDFIFIEGQFRYKQILDKYFAMFENKGYDYLCFQFNLDLEEMKKRDIELRGRKSSDINEVKKDIDSFVPNNAIQVNTSQSVGNTMDSILTIILSS